jgi:hypothetical protein
MEWLRWCSGTVDVAVDVLLQVLTLNRCVLNHAYTLPNTAVKRRNPTILVIAAADRNGVHGTCRSSAPSMRTWPAAPAS